MAYAGSAIANEFWAGVDGDQDSRTIRYLVTSAVDDNDALDRLEEPTGGAPLFYDNMPRENIRIREISKKDGIYEGVAVYTRRSSQKPAPDTNAAAVNVTGASAGTEEDPDKELFSFEVSAVSQIETHARDVSAAAVKTQVGLNNKSPAAFYELIPFVGFNYDQSYGYRGTEVLRPQASFSLDIYPEDSKVTRTYQNAVMAAVGKVNNATFRKWDAGEVMLTSARGESRNGADWRFSYTFAVRENRATVNLGNTVVINNVEGWDYVDPYWVERVITAGGEKWSTRVCRQAIVWRLYDRTDFSGLFV